MFIQIVDFTVYFNTKSVVVNIKFQCTGKNKKNVIWEKIKIKTKRKHKINTIQRHHCHQQEKPRFGGQNPQTIDARSQTLILRGGPQLSDASHRLIHQCCTAAEARRSNRSWG